MKEFNQQQLEALKGFVAQDRFSTGQSNRELHIHDISPHWGELPAGIIWPVNTTEVADILAWCYPHGVPGRVLKAILYRPKGGWSWI